MKFAALVAALFVAMTLSARTAADFFAEAPDDAVPLLTNHNRLDMLDYFNSGVENGTSNMFDGKARVTESQPMLLSAKISSAAEIQVAVIPVKGDTVVAFIETVASPTKDSALRLYRASDWQALPDVKLPTLLDFVPEKNRPAMATTDMPDMFFIGITYDPDQQLFMVYNNTFDNIPAFEQPAAAKLMDSVQAYRYNGRKLVRVKEFKQKLIEPAEQ